AGQVDFDVAAGAVGVDRADGFHHAHVAAGAMSVDVALDLLDGHVAAGRMAIDLAGDAADFDVAARRADFIEAVFRAARHLDGEVDAGVAVAMLGVTRAQFDAVAAAQVFDVDAVAVAAFFDRRDQDDVAVVAGDLHVARHTVNVDVAPGPEFVPLTEILRRARRG